MKRLSFILLTIFFCGSLYAENPLMDMWSNILTNLKLYKTEQFYGTITSLDPWANPYEKGQLLVKWKECSESAMKGALKELKMESLELLIPPRLYLVRCPIGKEKESANKLAERGLTEYIYPNYKLVAQKIDTGYTPNDYSVAWYYDEIKMKDAFAVATGNVNMIKVAVCDSGVVPTHKDLLSLDWSNPSEKKVVNAVVASFDARQSPPASVSNGVTGTHGTMVAGCTTMKLDNGTGGIGTAPNSLIISETVATGGGGNTADLARGIKHAADQGCRVINLSMGPWYGGVARDAGQYCMNKNAVHVVSAGNGGSTVPGSYGVYEVVHVAASGPGGSLAGFSERGTAVDIVAPGANTPTTNTSGGYSAPSGTSFSAPVTAGLLGLAISVCPSMTAEQAMILLYVSAPSGGPSGVQYGLINCEQTVKRAKELRGLSKNEITAKLKSWGWSGSLIY